MSIDRWMDNEVVVYIYSMEYYSAMKRNEFESVLLRCINLEAVYPEWSKSEKNTYYMVMHIYIYISYLEKW